MKHLPKKVLSLLSKLVNIFVYLLITGALLIAAFALYVKIYTLDISFIIDYLKKEQIIDDTTNVESLVLNFDTAFSVNAKNIDIKADNLSINLDNANIILSRSSFLIGTIAAKDINIDSAKIEVNLDEILKTNDNNTTNHKEIIKKIRTIAKWTKSAVIKNSDISVTYNNEKQLLDNINLKFYKSKQLIILSANGVYKLIDNNSPIQASINIDENTQDITLNIKADNLKSQDLIHAFLPNDQFTINGQASLEINADLKTLNKLNNITGNVAINNGFVAIPSLYNNNLNFNNVNSKFNYNIKDKKVEFNQATLIDDQNNNFDIFGDFSFIAEPTLNITVKTAEINALKAFTYIPDFTFTNWLKQNIHQGTAKNVSFGFYGPLRKTLDGENGNPYFDISTNFENVELSYLDGIPLVENANGKFKMLKKDITINVDNATHSQQNVERASVNIAPLFEEQSPIITIKALAKGSVEDVLNVLNTKLNLKQDEIFSHYKGIHETQASINLNLNHINSNGEFDDQFIKLDVRSDIPEVTGIDPVFKQRFEATDAVVKLTQEDFLLEASGFTEENPFSLVLQEKLLEFGQHTKLKINSNFDPFLIKQYVTIPTFNLSGLVYSELELNKQLNKWAFNLDANVEDSLVNFGLLNYTKPFSKPGLVSAKGYYDAKNEILNLEQSIIKSDDVNINGYANIVLNNLSSSTAHYNNIIIKDKTDVDEFSLQSNILTIRGKKLDARPFDFLKELDKLPNNPQEKSIVANKQNTKTIKKINIKLDSLNLTDTKQLKNVTVILNNTQKITGLIRAQKNEGEQNFYIKLNQDTANKNIVKVESLMPDLGEYLNRSGLSSKFKSGHGILFGDLVYDDKNTFDYANLTLNVKKFQVIEAPILAKALASISLEQIFSKKEGILFDDLYTKLHYEDGILKFSEGKIKGPSLGILFSGAYDFKTKTTDIPGTLIPVVKLNSIVSNIPVLGYILTGSQGALSGADFKIYGTDGKTDVSVQPLSVVTPGIVKDLFDSVSSGSTNESKAIIKARKKANIESKSKQTEEQ